jgi:ubiquitin conjugation factor E4 B
VLNYLAQAIQLNVKRGGSHVDPATVASDGFMLNLSAALLRLSEPFLDVKFSKVRFDHRGTRENPRRIPHSKPTQLERVDPLYYARSSRLDIAEETRLLADAPTAKAFREAHHEGWLKLLVVMPFPDGFS